MEKSHVMKITLVLMILLIFPIISAYRTDISVKTEPNQLISINAFDPVNDDKLFNVFERADASGNYKTTISTTIKYINIDIVSKDSANVVIGKEEFVEYQAGSPISVDFSKPKETEENKTEQKTTEIIEDEKETEEGPGFITATGSAVKDIVTNKITYYILGGLVLLIIILIVIKVIKSRSGLKEIRVRRLSELKDEDDRKSNKDISVAEKKLAEAQKEISKLKNKGKIERLEDELKRLKSD